MKIIKILKNSHNYGLILVEFYILEALSNRRAVGCSSRMVMALNLSMSLSSWVASNTVFHFPTLLFPFA